LNKRGVVLTHKCDKSQLRIFPFLLILISSVSIIAAAFALNDSFENITFNDTIINETFSDFNNTINQTQPFNGTFPDVNNTLK